LTSPPVEAPDLWRATATGATNGFDLDLAVAPTGPANGADAHDDFDLELAELMAEAAAQQPDEDETVRPADDVEPHHAPPAAEGHDDVDPAPSWSPPSATLDELIAQVGASAGPDAQGDHAAVEGGGSAPEAIGSAAPSVEPPPLPPAVTDLVDPAPPTTGTDAGVESADPAFDAEMPPETKLDPLNFTAKGNRIGHGLKARRRWKR
jgi:hypothetical protein